jgi:hypothetical protein
LPCPPSQTPGGSGHQSTSQVKKRIQRTRYLESQFLLHIYEISKETPQNNLKATALSVPTKPKLTQKE